MAKETRGLPKTAAAGAADDGYHYSLGQAPRMSKNEDTKKNYKFPLPSSKRGSKMAGTTHSPHSVKVITAQQHLEI